MLKIDMTKEEKSYRIKTILILLLITGISTGIMLGAARASSPEPNSPDSFGTGQHMSTTSLSGAFIPVIKAAADGRLMLVYNHSLGNEVENPYFRQSADGGTTWSDPAPIQDDDTSLLEVNLAFDTNNKAHAVWRTANQIWHAREDEWPASINSNIVVSATGESVRSPDIAVAPNNTLHVVWAQGEKVYHAYSTDGGESWETPVALSPGTGQRKSDVPDIVIDSAGNVHIVWEERITLLPLHHEIHYIKGTVSPSDITWDASSTLLSASLDVAKMPAIQLAGNMLHVAFADRIDQWTQYAYYVSSTLGSNWSAPQDITQGDPLIMNTNIPFVLMPSLDVCSDKLVVYFHGALEENHMEMIMGVNNGDNWQNREQVTEGDIRAIRPSLVCVGGILHTAYEVIITPNVNHQIYYVAGMANATYLPHITAE